MPVVVLPTYQEAENIGPMIAAIRAVLPEATVLVVDDASPDGTAERAVGAVVLRRSGPRGLGAAYRDGFRWALSEGFTEIFQMDADFSHDPADLVRLRTGADLCLGSRYVPGGGTRNWGLHRRLLSRFGSLYARHFLNLPIADLTGGFKCWKNSTLSKINLEEIRSDGYGFQVEMTYRAVAQGARVVEVPILFTERRAGNSKMNLEIAMEAARLIPWLGRTP